MKGLLPYVSCYTKLIRYMLSGCPGLALKVAVPTRLHALSIFGRVSEIIVPVLQAVEIPIISQKLISRSLELSVLS